jgi:carboxypeptidase PM20D1
MKRFFLALGGGLALLSAVMIVRAALFTSRQIHVTPATSIKLDREAMVARLAEAIKLKTVSFRSLSDEGATEIQRLHQLLANSFPRVHQRLEREIVNQHSLLYTWKGTEPNLRPTLFMAHMDVVPVDTATEKSWTQPAFSGMIADGYIWGRGTMDDKASVLGLLESVEYLLSENFKPRRTVYLAFGHDEETDGNEGAAKIAELLASRKIQLEYVLDEGMNILSGVFDDIGAPVALIGIAEKGYLTVQLTAKSPGGHSSTPAKNSTIATISRAIQRLDAAPFPAKLDGATRQMFDYLGPEMSWPKKFVLANLWLTRPLVRRQLTQSPLTNALVRTTLAPTVFHAGARENVLPTEATALVNLRIMPGESTIEAMQRVRRIVNDPKIELAAASVRVEPSVITKVDSPSFFALQGTIREIAPEAIVAPALLVGATDSRHYAKLTENIFRFLPIALQSQDIKRYHGIDERISIQDYERCVRFYTQMIRNSN